MKSKLSNKDKLKYFLSQLDIMLCDLGATKQNNVGSKYHILPYSNYTFNIPNVGPYICHPGVPIKLDHQRLNKKSIFIEVFGQFQDWDKAGRYFSHWKKNFHYGYVFDKDIEWIDNVVQDLFCHIQRIVNTDYES